MNGRKSTAVVALAAATALLMGTLPTLAQDEEFPLPGSETPLEGYTRTDGTIVLSDRAFCRHLLGSLWGDDALTYVELINGSRKEKPARQAAFEPGSDEDTLARCADIIAAFRTDPPEDDAVAAWARRSPVVPESLASLLPDDFEARPLAQPEEVGPAARTTGYGDTVSAPFEMESETWLAEVDAVGCSEWSASLNDARDPSRIVALTGIREYLYNVDPGHYYWKVSAPDCDWSIDLVPIELGPDPDATPVPLVPVPLLHGESWDRRLGADNSAFLTAAQAREALLAAGLTAGDCVEEERRGVPAGRVWGQEPRAGTLVELGSAVDVYAVSDCDIVLGDRVAIE